MLAFDLLPIKELSLQVREFDFLFAYDRILVQVCAFTLAFFFSTNS